MHIIEVFKELISILEKENPTKAKEYNIIKSKIDNTYAEIAKKLDFTPEKINDFRRNFETALRDNLIKLSIPTEKIADILKKTWNAFSRFSTPEKFISTIIGPIVAWFWISSFMAWAWALIESTLSFDLSRNIHLASIKAMELAVKHPKTAWLVAWSIPGSWKWWLWDIINNNKYRIWFQIWWIVKDFRDVIMVKANRLSTR